MSSSSIAAGFRFAASAAAAAMLVQAVLAGLALSGHSLALSAHMLNGAAVFILSVAEMVFAILLRRRNELPRWPFVAGAAVLLGQILQMASGRFLFLSAHVPLGVGLFGLMTVLAYWAWVWRPVPASGSGAPAVALKPLREYQP
jgi:hypothetical protein